MCENFQAHTKCLLSVLSGHFDGLLLVMSATKESKQQNRRKTENWYTCIQGTQR